MKRKNSALLKFWCYFLPVACRADDGLSTYRCLLRRRIAAGEVESDSGLTDSEDEDEELVSK